jgi:hypothetical protein
MSMGIEPVGRNQGVSAPAGVDQPSAVDDASKKKLEEAVKLIEQLFKLLAEYLGKKNDEDAGADEGAAPPSGAGSQGGKPAGGGGKAPAAGGGGGGDAKAPAAGGGKAAKERAGGDGNSSKPAQGNGGKNQEGPVGAGRASVDIDKDGKADVSIRGDGAADYAKEVEALAAKVPEVGQQMLDGAKANPNGVFEIEIKDLGGDNAGMASVGNQKGVMEIGKVQIDDEWRKGNIEHVLVHEMAHNRGYTHGDDPNVVDPQEAEMKQEVERLVGPE